MDPLIIAGIILFVLLLVGAGFAFLMFYKSRIAKMPYPNCNGSNYVWNITFTPSSKFANMHDLVTYLAARKWERGPSYPIYIKQTVIGTVSNGTFTQSNDISNVTPGTYLLTPISSTNLCQSGKVTISK